MSDIGLARLDLASSVDTGWGPTARAWGAFAGAAFAVATAAFVIEATGLLGGSPEFVATTAGPVADEASFRAASFAYQQQVLWDYVLRDGLFFFAFLALIPLGLGLREVAGRRRVSPQLAAAFLGIAAVFGAMNAFQTFVMVDYWGNSGWDQVPATTMVAVGRDLGLMDALTRWAGVASYAALAIALYYVGRTCRTSAAMPGWLGLVAYAGTAVLVTMTAASVAPDTDALMNLLSLAIGVLIAPVVTIGLGRSISRAATGATSSPELRNELGAS
jgi:hypothetical protein